MRVIEILSGDYWEVYIDKNIFKPLRMHRSYFDHTPYHLLPYRSNNYTVVDGTPGQLWISNPKTPFSPAAMPAATKSGILFATCKRQGERRHEGGPARSARAASAAPSSTTCAGCAARPPASRRSAATSPSSGWMRADG